MENAVEAIPMETSAPPALFRVVATGLPTRLPEPGSPGDATRSVAPSEGTSRHTIWHGRSDPRRCACRSATKRDADPGVCRRPDRLRSLSKSPRQASPPRAFLLSPAAARLLAPRRDTDVPGLRRSRVGRLAERAPAGARTPASHAAGGAAAGSKRPRRTRTGASHHGYASDDAIRLSRHYRN